MISAHRLFPIWISSVFSARPILLLVLLRTRQCLKTNKPTAHQVAAAVVAVVAAHDRAISAMFYHHRIIRAISIDTILTRYSTTRYSTKTHPKRRLGQQPNKQQRITTFLCHLLLHHRGLCRSHHLHPYRRVVLYTRPISRVLNVNG